VKYTKPKAQCFDGIKRLCHIRGKMRKRVWVSAGDIVLVGLRDYQAHPSLPSTP
jgi:translation initiation factor 1A